MKRPVSSDSDIFLVAQLAAAFSVAAFFYYLRHNDLLLYGDAVAHINIARRVFDSRTPGPLQLGTVWLPLPHILMMPFLVSRWLWQTGIGGTIPSLFAYVLTVSGVFRLTRSTLAISSGTESTPAVRFAAWLAALIFALNPNLLYLQTTAMTEPIYLAFFVWAAVYFCEAFRLCTKGDPGRGNLSLTRAGWCLLGACLTRYDGWFLAAVLVAVGFAFTWIGNFKTLQPGVKKLILLAAAGPALWLAYNAAVYRNPLEFANGPYSAKAIEQKTAVPGFPPHPGSDNLPVAFQYFFKAAQLNMSEGKLQSLWVINFLFGTAVVVLFQRRLWPALLLWVPVPFYMLSIAHSGVPIFVPVWWPFSRYNVRYGVELLPAFAVLTAIGGYGLIRFASTRRRRLIIAVVFVAITTASYVQLFFFARPESFQEAVVNSRTRTMVERQLASILATLPSNSTYLMYLGDHVGAFQRAAIPLSHVINEGNHRPWRRPSDPDGLWEKALANPGVYADYVIAFDGDSVATSVDKNQLVPMTVIHVTGQPAVTLYRTSKSNQPG
jgi:hypothetical protein